MEGNGEIGIVARSGQTVLLVNAALTEARIDPAATNEQLRDAIRALVDAWRLGVESARARTGTRSARALEADPYAFNGYTFAEFVARDVELRRGPASSETPDIVRRRIVDDVEATHRMLDNLDVPPGTLATRVALALLGDLRGPKITGPVATNVGDLVDGMFGGLHPERRGRREPAPTKRAPIADAEAVGIPEPDAVFAVLSNLTGEEVFKVFDACEVLPEDPATVKGWVLTDEAHVGAMVHDCLEIALTRGKLADVYKAGRESVARKRGTR